MVFALWIGFLNGLELFFIININIFDLIVHQNNSSKVGFVLGKHALS